MRGTRIASISGLRGVVGDGLDPVVAVGVRRGLRRRVRAGADRGQPRRPGLVAGLRAGGRWPA